MLNHEPRSPLTAREPIVVIVGAGVALLNTMLLALFSFLTLEPGQVAALFAIPNAAGAFVVAIVARGRVAPWEPIDLPDHAHDAGWSDPDPSPTGL